MWMTLKAIVCWAQQTCAGGGQLPWERDSGSPRRRHRGFGCPEIKELPLAVWWQNTGLWKFLIFAQVFGHLVLLFMGYFILPYVPSSIIFFYSWEELGWRLIQNKTAILKSQLFHSYIPKKDLM